MRVRFLTSAYRDLERLHEFLRPKNPEAADRAIDVLYDAAESLEDAPHKGRPISGGFRDHIVPFGSAAYIMRYRMDEHHQSIAVVRIWHSREQRD